VASSFFYDHGFQSAHEFITGDPAAIHPFLAEISKDRRNSEESKHDGEIDTGAAALHLAVRCASGK